MASSLEDENRGKSDANQIYLLTGKNYRISRSIKVQWFFQHFNCVVSPNPDDVISSSKQELEVLSVLPKGPAECSNKCIVVPSTLITFLGRIYKFVFCLDVSQSLANVDILSGKVVNEISFESFQNCVRGLVLPFSVPGSTLVLSPELHLTILGYNGVVDYGTVQVLVEGFLVNQDNVEPFLSTVYDKLQHMENKNASVAQGTCNQDANDTKRPLSHVTTELSIVAMLKMSLLALQLLPGTASGGIVVISDGVFGLPSAAVVHALLAELRSHTVCCSFVKVGSPFQAHCSFGYIPNIDLMQFLSVATSGAYLCKTPPIEELAEKMEKTVSQDLPPMNFYHKAFLCWSFQREYDLSKISSWEDMNEFLASKRFSANIHTPLSQWKKALTEPLIRKRHLERTLKTTISSVLSVRLREGYCIEDITFHRGGKELAVKLLLLWKQNVRIEYTATSTWPVAAANPQTRIEVVVQGNYEFLHDVYTKQLYSMKGYRANVVETFNHTLKSLEMTDALIVSLQSFSSNRVYYTIPESARKGVPLFYLPPNSPQPVLSLEQGKSRKSSKSQEAQFGVFWKTILSLDVNIWQRWMHCHRINVVLEHDRPLPKSLYLPGKNDRFYHIQCRNALSSLATLLKQWSSFVLLDNHTYIKFVDGEDPEGTPRSFCILRLSSKTPCVVIRLAFLGGMPGKERHEVVNALRDKIKAITAQFAPPGNLSKESQKGSVNQVERQMHEWLVCTKLLHKPLDRILVRYDELPKEFLVRLRHSEKSSGVMETFEPWMHRTKGVSESPLKVLSRYLYHQRWVFTLRHPEDGTTPSANTISKILRCITKLREDQGYKFIASNLGVTTMFKELWVKETGDASEPLTTCVVQFVMFPPLTSATHNRVVGWALDSRLPEDDRDSQLVMEVWVEPQEGVIMESEKPDYLIGKHYHEIPAKIFEADLGYISAWLTYDLLRRMCDDRVVCSPGQAIVDIAPPPNDPEMKSLIYEVPFSFDVMKVLRCSKRTKIMFSTLIENEKPVLSKSSHHRANDVLFDYILEHMKRLHDRELILTPEDSQRFSTLVQNTFSTADPDETVIWRCFTRVESGHLLLTFLPASYHSLQNLSRVASGVGPETGVGDEHNTFDSEQPIFLPRRPSSRKDQHEHDSADSRDDDTSKETLGKFWCSTKVSKRSSVDLSLFVYDFAVSSLAEDGLSGDRQPINEALLDYRNKLDRFENDKILDMSKESRSHSMAIYELFSWCFVSTVFESLRRGESVDDGNLDDVLAICSDHIPEEIDITEFLGNICGHINPSVNKASQAPYFAHEDESYESQKQRREESATEFLRNNCDPSVSDPQWDEKCEELSEMHDFIQKRFSALLGKYFAPIPNKMDHYFYRPYCLQDSFLSDGEETDEEAVDNSSDGGSHVVFESEEEEREQGEEECHSDNLLCQRDQKIDNRGSLDSTNSVETRDDLLMTSIEDEDFDFPSDRSDLQSSIKDGDIMDELRDIEQEYNVPLFLNLSYTIRDRSHLSSTMVSMSAEYLPTCLAEIVDQAKRDPDLCIDSSISSLLITLDLICLVPPREPDYSRWKSRNHYRARSNSLSSLSSISDTPLEKIVRFDDVSGTNHDRESSFTVSGLPHFQIDSIREIKRDINWLLQDEIVFSLCHAPSITLDMLENVTKHISQSQGLETEFSQFRSIQLHFVVLDAEKGLATFIEELDKVRIGGHKLSKLENYHYLRLPSSTAASSLSGCQAKSNTTEQLSESKDEIVETESKDSDDELLVDFTSLFSDDSHFPNSAEEDVNMHFGKSSSRHQSQSRDTYSELWLILKKTESDTLDVYFHTRETHDGKYHYLYLEATSTVQTLFHLVNQKLLLRYVYDERVCHPLLQPRSEDDIWNESRPYSSSPHSVFDVRNDSKVVNPEYRFQPGHFKCPVRWTKNFPIHFRLRGNTPRNSAAVRAIKALQTVLDKFSLNEKTNMYVYQEKTTGDIYYFSLDESLCLREEVEVEGGEHGADYGQEESLLSLPMSRSSSCLSLSKAGTAELEEDLDDCARKVNGGLTAEKDTVSLNGSLFSQPISEHVEQCIVLCVHGVTEPGDEIKKDLVSVLQKRLDDFTLEMLMMSLARNANTKLALQDVQFIQPPKSTPASFIRFVLPSFASKNLHPFSLFFKQHLLDYLHSPRYTTKVEAFHFQKFVRGEGYSKALAENDVFIFSKPCIPGAKGVACLSVNITDSRGNTLHISPDRKEMGFLNHARKCSVKESTYVETIEEFVNLPTRDSDELPVDAIVIEIFIWERGDVGISLLRERLRKSIRHALCDVLIEYYLLTASFSYIPEKYNCTNSSTQERYKNVKTRVTSKPVYPEIHIDCGGISSKSKFKQSHRRTPSAGSLGCGRRHSPATPTFRPSVSEPVTPISFGSSASDSAQTCQPGNFILIEDEEDAEVMALHNKENVSGSVGKSAQTLLIPADSPEKVRSHSVGSQPNYKSFRPIPESSSHVKTNRALSDPQGTLGVSKHHSKSGRFSPFESFTENELTESKEFGDEATKANEGFCDRGARKTSAESASPSFTEQEMQVIKRCNDEMREERTKYENGQKGELHPSFQGPAQELLQFAKELDSHSVHVQKGTLLTRYSVDAVLYELMNLVKLLCPDLNSKIYRAVPSNSSSQDNLLTLSSIQYVLYDPIRPPLLASDKGETSVDRSGSYMATSAGPAPSFLLISRNVTQWRNNLQRIQDYNYVEPDIPSVLKKDFYASQQFQSWNWDDDDSNERTKETTAPFSNCAPGFVSRQRLVLIDIKDKEIIATTYNLSSDINTQLSLRLIRLVNWNNARCHLVSCLFHQKMGLFHHTTFQGLNVGGKDINPFCETVNDHHLFSLLKQTAPNPPERSASSQKQIPSVGKLLFEETLRDVIPPKPLHTTKHCSYRDPVKRHGAQFQEIRAIQIRKAVQNAELQKLFTSWLNGPFNIITGDNSINLLKRQSRLIHFYKTPFLVSDEWMTSVQEKANIKPNQGDPRDQYEEIEDDTNDEVEEDEWHYKLREEFINYYTQYVQSQRFALVQSASPAPHKTAKGQKKPSKQLRKKGVSDRPKQPIGNESSSTLKPLHYYLQKTTDGSNGGETYAYDGGIMLLELGYEGCHFFVKLYAFESSKLNQHKLNQQTKNTFLAECSKMKELTHLSSFSYDFHLRHVQYFLFGQRLVFPKGFRLTSMLTKLMKLFIYPPKFSWNHVCRGVLPLKLCNLPRATVFSYIVEHARRYGLSMVEMNDKEEKPEHVLISTSAEKTQYDVSLLVKLGPTVEGNVLSMKFFVVMTHRRELFPKMKPESRHRKISSGFSGEAGLRFRNNIANIAISNSPELENVFKGTTQIDQDNLKRSSSSPQVATPVLLSADRLTSPHSDERFRLSSATSGTSSSSLIHSTSPQANAAAEKAYVIKGLEADPSDSLMSWDMRNLKDEAVRCCDRLLKTVSSAQEHCMRDHLWHLLLKGASSDETMTESSSWKAKGLRKKTEYRRNLSDYTETWPVPSSLKDVADSKGTISCEDFEHLLDLVKPVSLPVVDETFKPFLSMDTGWYINLWSFLLNKFGDRSREFSKCEGKMHYFVLLNPKNLDMFIFISVHEEKRLTEVKIATRTSFDERKKTARVVPKSGDDFVQEVVNALCYQMWTGLLLG